jgi:hypothetical protein
MATLSRKIDFAVTLTVQHANPNGDRLTATAHASLTRASRMWMYPSAQDSQRWQDLGHNDFCAIRRQPPWSINRQSARTSRRNVEGVNMATKRVSGKRLPNLAGSARLCQVFAIKKKGKKSERAEDTRVSPFRARVPFRFTCVLVATV